MPLQKGQTNNPYGRSPIVREKFKWDFLDMVAIPKAIKKLYEIVADIDPEIQCVKKSEKLRLQIDAAKALLAKAPQRHEGTGEDSEIVVKIMQNIIKTNGDSYSI